jgi:hypothetical protein
MVLPKVDISEVERRFRPRVPSQLLGGYFVAVGLALERYGSECGRRMCFGRPTPVEPDAFQVVAALDLSIMVPLLVVGGTLMWCRLHGFVSPLPACSRRCIC